MRVALTSIAPIDISTATEPSPTNSLYRIQSAHVRCCILLQAADQQGLIELDPRSRSNWKIIPPLLTLTEYTWDSPLAASLATQLQAVPEIIQQSAKEIAPHLTCHHLEAMSETCHQWLDNMILNPANLALILTAKQTIFDLMENILSITVPDSMNGLEGA